MNNTLDNFTSERDRHQEELMRVFPADNATLRVTLSQFFAHAHDGAYSGCKQKHKDKLDKLMMKKNSLDNIDLSGMQLKK